MDNDTVLIETTLHAPIQQAWKAWTDPLLILKWFGSDPNGNGIKAELDVRPGGSFEITFKDSDQTEHTCNGKYLVVQQPNKLSFTWSWKKEPGVESFVTVELISENNSTRMKFEHAKVGNASAHNYLKGWKATFQKLEQLLAKELQ